MVEKDLLKELNFKEEIAEEYNAGSYGAYVRTGFPQPKRRYRLVYESQQASIEHTYFWVYNHLVQDMGYGDVVKIVDTFGGSENSTFWGVTQQRQSIQQDRASQYLATIGKMVKELFQIVREIRILKERLRLYKGSYEGRHADDIALKGYWVDMVEGGQRQQANIYVIAQQLGFGTLPDLFYKIYVREGDDATAAVDKQAAEFNDKVKEVLKRKLSQYVAWRGETHKELLARERFTLRYLRQHWAIIRMYMSWVKPYLRNVQKLQAPDKYDRNPELISSFEGALMEIEFIAKKASDKQKEELDPDGKKTKAPIYPCILATFTYRVRPLMQFQTEYQRGPVHVGRVEFTLRAYGWTQKDIEAYMKYREQESLELLGMVDQSVRDAMDALGEDLRQYLKEAGEDVLLPSEREEDKKTKDKKKETVKVDLFEPFRALFDGFKEVATMPFEGLVPSKEKVPALRGADETSDGVAKGAAGIAFNVYKNYKSAHGMPKW